MALILTDESKVTLRKYEELWNETRDLTRSKINNADNCEEKYMEIKFNSDGKLPLKNRTL